MGIRGLATFINHYSNKYLEEYKLQNCYLVIDGNSLACQLYNGCTKVNGAFGGDYDRYTVSVVEFFKILQKCNIAPIVIFDGGYERKKLHTTLARMRQKWRTAKYVTPMTQNRNRIFPLFLKESIKDVLKELQIPFAQCLFEADVEIAAVARSLKCPVLSYDSDFFVYNCLYIPFPTLHSLPYKERSTDQISYLHCKIYRVEHFLKRSGIQKEILPFLSILLGCDYVGNSVYKCFVSHLMQKKCRGPPKHSKISSLLYWLQTETLESAKTKVLRCMRKCKRPGLTKQINKITSMYVNGSSELLSVLGIEVQCCESEYTEDAKNMLESLEEAQGDLNVHNNVDDAIHGNEVFDDDEDNDNCEDAVKDEFIDDRNISNCEDSCADSSNELDDASNCNISSGSENFCESEVESEINGSDEEIEESHFEGTEKQKIKYHIPEMKFSSRLPEWFLECFMQGKFPSAFMDMFIHHRYFVPPQVEDYSYCSSHIISLPLIAVIYGLIIGCRRNKLLRCHIREFHKANSFVDVQPVFQSASVRFPPLEDLPNLSLLERFLILMETVEFNSDDQKCIMSLPSPWQLYIIALVAWARQAEEPSINNSHVDSLLLCLILLNVTGKSEMYSGSTKQMRNRRKRNLKKIKSFSDNISPLTLGTTINNIDNVNSSILENQSGVEKNVTECEQSKENDNVVHTNTNINSVVDTLQDISLVDCRLAKKCLHPFCLMENKLKSRPKLFCISTVHSFAQFQSCLLHLIYLNALLGYPFPHCVSYKVFSGTFVYNMCSNLQKRTDSLAYISHLLSPAPSIVKLFKVLRKFVDNLVLIVPSNSNVKRKPRKKKRTAVVSEKEEKLNDSEEPIDSDFEDPCNRFAALALKN